MQEMFQRWWEMGASICARDARSIKLGCRRQEYAHSKYGLLLRYEDYGWQECVPPSQERDNEEMVISTYLQRS